MTKFEAYQAMLDGKTVRHLNYSIEESIHMDSNRHIRDENDYDMGDQFGEFWTKYQKWEDGWSITNGGEESAVSQSSISEEDYKRLLGMPDGHIGDKLMDIKLSNPYTEYHNLRSRLKPIVNEPKVQRNEPCMCGSGKKFKKCCNQ